MARHKSTQAAIKELHDKCGLPMVQCREALEAHGPQVDQALGVLIDSGRVTLAQLDPDLCSDALFARAQMAETQRAMGKMLRMGEGILRDARRKGEIPSESKAKKPNESPDPLDMDMSDLMALALQAMSGADMQEMLGRTARETARMEKKRAERKKKGPVTCELPPFPPLTFGEFFWEGKDTLPEWAGFQERLGAYTARSSDKPSKGQVNLSVSVPGDDEAHPPALPSAEQVKAFAFLKENGPAVAQAILKAIYKKYPRLRENYLYDEEEAKECMPAIQKVEDLRKLIGLGTVHVLAVAKNGAAYVGFEFGCTWDEEHGLGVMTHGKRVIGVGDASKSFEPHNAKDDGGRDLRPSRRDK